MAQGPRSGGIGLGEIKSRLEHTIHVCDGYMKQFHQRWNVTDATDVRINELPYEEWKSLMTLYERRTQALQALGEVIANEQFSQQRSSFSSQAAEVPTSSQYAREPVGVSRNQ